MREVQLDTDCRSFREALAIMGERQSLGIVVADATGSIMFCSARAKRILGARASLPTEILRLADGSKDEETTKLMLEGNANAVGVRAVRIAGTPRHVLVTLEEERPRATLSKGLVKRFGLSARSVQLVQLTSRGLTNREIGERLRLSEATVKTYMHGLFREVGVRNRAELVALAERLAQEDGVTRSAAADQLE